MIGRDADSKHITAFVLLFPVDTEVLVTGRITDLELDLILVDVLGAAVDVKHGGLVLLAEFVPQVVDD